MIEKKFKFYIDSKVQPSFCNKRVLVRKLDLSIDDPRTIKDAGNYDRLMACVEYFDTNSQNQIVKEFCKENNIPEKVYYNAIRNFTNLKLVNLKLIDIDLIPSSAEFFPSTHRIVRDLLAKIYNQPDPYIIKIHDSEYYKIPKEINFGKDIIISKNLLDNTKIANGFKYRIYINDRLLIERFFPRDLSLSKIICEECYISLNKPVNVKIVTDYDLIFSKIVADKNTYYPNSTEFILEP
jgi:hypothetical protein